MNNYFDTGLFCSLIIITISMTVNGMTHKIVPGIWCKLEENLFVKSNVSATIFKACVAPEVKTTS